MKKNNYSFLREFIREANEPAHAAGIIVFRSFSDGMKVLILKTNGSYMDLPKGRIEKDETYIETALRETREETGLTDITFPWGLESIKCSKCVMFAGVTESDPVMQRNPVTKEFEHTGYMWAPKNSKKINLKSYIQPSIPWAWALAGY